MKQYVTENEICILLDWLVRKGLDWENLLEFHQAKTGAEVSIIDPSVSYDSSNISAHCDFNIRNKKPPRMQKQTYKNFDPKTSKKKRQVAKLLIKEYDYTHSGDLSQLEYGNLMATL